MSLCERHRTDATAGNLHGVVLFRNVRLHMEMQRVYAIYFVSIVTE